VLFALLVIASRFGLDVVLGAFLAGVVLRRWAPLDVQALEAKLDAVGYGFFIPVFFVSSGMSLDLASIVESPARLLVFFLLFLVVRGLPALVFYRHDLPMRGRVQMMLLTATALPLLVALSHIGLESGTMLPENAAALVGAGVLSVIVFHFITNYVVASLSISQFGLGHKGLAMSVSAVAIARRADEGYRQTEKALSKPLAAD